MVSDISTVRRNMLVLLAIAVILGFAFLYIVTPIVNRLSLEALDQGRLNYFIFTPPLLLTLLVLTHLYLRPIARLSDLLEENEPVPAELAQKARTLAFTLPQRFQHIPVLITFAVATLSDVLSALLVENYGFWDHYSGTILITIVAASIASLVSLISRRILTPVLLVTADLAEDHGPRFDIRSRQLSTILTFTFIATTLLSVLSYNMMVQSLEEGLRDKYRELGAHLLSDWATDTSTADLPEAVTALSFADQADAFLVDRSGRLMTQLDSGVADLLPGEPLDTGVESRDVPGGEVLLFPVPQSSEGLHMGFVYRIEPLQTPLIRHFFVVTLVIIVGLFAFAFVTNRYVADDLTRDIDYVAARLRELAKGELDFQRLHVLSLDEVGDLVVALNQVQEQFRKQQAQVEERRQLADSLAHVAQIVNSTLEMDQVLSLALEHLEDVVPYDAASILLYDGDCLTIAAGRGFRRPGDVIGSRFRPEDNPIGYGVMTSQTTRVVPDVQALPEWGHGRTDVEGTSTIRSWIGAPLVVQGESLGLLVLDKYTPNFYGDVDGEKVAAFAPQIATAVHNARLFEDAQARAQEMAQMAEDLAEEKSKLDAILRNVTAGLLVTDAQNAVLMINPAFEQMFGIPADDLVGRDLSTVLTEVELCRLVNSALTEQDVAFMAEIPLADGRTLKASSAAIQEQGRLVGVVTVLRDITHEKEVDRMKTDFISTVSHELRTPLTSVLGFAKLIRRTFDRAILPVLPGERRTQKAAQRVGENLDIIVAEGERLTRLINDVLDVAKIESGKLEWNDRRFDLAELIQHSEHSVRALADKKGLAISIEVDERLSPITADPDRIAQVLTNLLSNAIKFTETGEIHIVARRLEPGACIHGWYVPPQGDGGVVVSVADTGVGIPEDEMAHLFQRFQQLASDTLTSKPKGTGLGLVICREIVTHYGGDIWVESTPEVGSTFYFTLPMAPVVTTDAPIPPVISEIRRRVTGTLPPSDGHGRAAQVLLVDDEPHIRALLAQELGEAGYQTLEAANGSEAIGLARRRHPDIILLDVMMPDISGFDVTRILKADKSTAGIPILILSIIEDHEHGLALGADAYMTKPVDSVELLETISSLLSQERDQRTAVVVARDRSAIEVVTAALREEGFKVVEVYDPRGAIATAQAVKPDLVVLDEVVSSFNNAEVLKALRFQSSSSRYTIVVIAGESSTSAQSSG